MYPAHALGKFMVPEIEQWVEAVSYRPEPPIVVRGSMNPWETERQREIYLAEESAWKTIQEKQIRYRSLRLQAEEQLVYFNRIVGEIEGLTGKKSGLLSTQNVASFAASSSGNPYLMAAMGVKMLVDLFMSSSKKKKIQSKMKDLEQIQARILALNVQMDTIAGEVGRLTMIGEAYREMQAVRSTDVARQSESAYAYRQTNERERAKALRAINLIARQRMPVQKGYDDAL